MNTSLIQRLRNKFYKNVKIHGYSRSYLLPSNPDILYAGYFTEDWLIKLLGKYFKSRDEGFFLDVGVNVGQTLLSIHECYPTLSYLGFEPNPHCVCVCTEIIRLNSIADYKVVPCALGASDSITALTSFRDSPIDSMASLLPSFRKKNSGGEYTYTVLIKKGDNVIDDFNLSKPISVIKIDVEGFETDVMAGLVRSIKKFKPLIIMEVLPHNNVNARVNQQERLELIVAELGYKISQIHIPSGSVKQVSSFLQNIDQVALSNYVLTYN